MGAFDDLIPTANLPTKGGPNAAPKADPRVSAARQLRAQLDRVQSIYRQTQQRPGAMALLEYNPFDAGNQQFDAASKGLAPLALAATRVPGTGTVSDKDADIQAQAYLPSSWSTDASNEERMRSLRSIVDGIDPPAPAMRPATARPAAPPMQRAPAAVPQRRPMPTGKPKVIRFEDLP